MKRAPVALLVLAFVGAACLLEALTPACQHGLSCMGGVARGGAAALAFDATTIAAAGLGLIVARLAWTQWRVSRALAAMRQPAPPRVELLGEQLGVYRVAVLPSRVSVAFCAGFFRPCVYLSDGLVGRLAEPELAAVLAHEAAHARRGDPLRLALGSFIGDLCFAVPLVARWRHRSVRRLELRADDAAARATSRAAVAGAVRALDTPLFGSDDVAAARAAHLLGNPCQGQRPAVRELGLSALGILALAVPLLCVAEAIRLIGGGTSPL